MGAVQGVDGYLEESGVLLLGCRIQSGDGYIEKSVVL